jgi:hypothetical protein
VTESTETPPRPSADAPPVSRRFIVAARLALLLLGAGALTAAVLIAARGGGAADSGVYYACPMHLGVRDSAPGQCPICRMALESAGRDVAASAMRSAGRLDTTAMENVRKHRIIDFVHQRTLLFDARELRAPAWVENDGTVAAVFYIDQIAALAADEPASFSPTQAPQARVAMRRTADPPVRWDQSTSRIRFRLDAARASVRLQPGQVGWVEAARKSRAVLAVPASAVLQSPEGPYVLAAVGNAKFEKRPIEIGETFQKQGFAVVLSGLRANDRVVSKATFFLDADRRLGLQTREEDWVAP